MAMTLGRMLALTALFGAGALAQGAQPQEECDWSLGDAWKVSTETRDKICLNGIWRVEPKKAQEFEATAPLSAKARMLANLAAGDAAFSKKPPVPKADFPSDEKDWGKSRIPGEWFESHWSRIAKFECVLSGLQSSSPRQGIHNGLKWKGVPLADCVYAWYEREFEMPSGWKPEDAFLRFENVLLEAWVFIGGKYVCHQTGNEYVEVPIPSDVKPGDKLKLDVLVGAKVDGEATVYMGAEQVHKEKKISQSRGISGDVWLVRRPASKRVEDVFVIPSFRKKELALRVEFKGLEGAPEGTLSGDIAPAAGGAPAKAFSLNASDGKKLEPGVYEYSVPWSDPVLWNPENPYLYNLKLCWKDAKDSLLDAFLPVRFGFRELWIDGRDIRLNGVPFRLRMENAGDFTKESAAAHFAEMKSLGFNSLECLGSIHGGAHDGELAEMADEAGIILIPVLPGVNDYTTSWNSKAQRDEWKAKAFLCIKELRNHPSVGLWAMNHNLLGYPFDLCPFYIGTDYLPKLSMGKDVAGKDSERLLLEMDPSRPFYHHAGGNFGPIHTSNIYLNFCPLQEKSEWLSHWAKNGVKPFIAVELGMPLDCSYYHGRAGFGTGKTYASEPCFTEYAAMILGPSAYKLWDDAMMKPVIESPVVPLAISAAEDGSKSDEYKNGIGWFYGPFRNKNTQDYQQSEEALGGFVKHWRSWGASGNPWINRNDLWNGWREYDGSRLDVKSFKTPGMKTIFRYAGNGQAKTGLWEKYRQWMAPELHYIAGPKSDFTDRTHIYRSGEKLVKSVATVNDSFHDVAAKATASLCGPDGKTLQSKELSINAKPGEIRFDEFSLDIPETSSPSQLVLKLEVDGGKGAKTSDSFALTAMPSAKPTVQVARKIWLAESGKGLTAKALSELGLKFQAYKGEELGAADLLIVGRESLPSAAPYSKAIKASVAKGLNVLVFEQSKGDLESLLGFRSVDINARDVFSSSQSHPITAGLDDGCLSTWRGDGTLLEARPKPENDITPRHLWRYGNRGTVAQVVLEKPHQGPFLSLIDQGFDLNYSALLLEKLGAGEILYCQLGLFGRTEPDPMADALLARILNAEGAAAKDPGRTAKRVLYAGAEKGRKTLALVGTPFVEAGGDVSKLAPSSDILVLGSTSKASPELVKIRKSMGLPPPDDFDAVAFAKSNAGALAKFMEDGGTIMLLSCAELKDTLAALGFDEQTKKMQSCLFERPEADGLTFGLSQGDFFWKDKVDAPLPSNGLPIDVRKAGSGRLLVCQADPFCYPDAQMNQRRERLRHKMTRTVSALMTNLGAEFSRSPLDCLSKASPSPVSLEGEWNFRIDPEENGEQLGWTRTPWDSGFRKLKVPGLWEDQGVKDSNPKWDEKVVPKGKLPYDGCAWYQKEVVIPSSLKGKDIFLEIGAVDDCDWTYLNGEMIGKTDKATPQWYAFHRFYKVPESLVKFDAPNLISIKVLDDYLGGGVAKGPVRIMAKQEASPFYQDSEALMRYDPYLFHRW